MIDAIDAIFASMGSGDANLASIDETEGERRSRGGAETRRTRSGRKPGGPNVASFGNFWQGVGKVLATFGRGLAALWPGFGRPLAGVWPGGMLLVCNGGRVFGRIF